MIDPLGRPQPSHHWRLSQADRTAAKLVALGGIVAALFWMGSCLAPKPPVPPVPLPVRTPASFPITQSTPRPTVTSTPEPRMPAAGKGGLLSR